MTKLNRHSVQKIGEHLVAVECYKRNWTCSIISGTQPNFDVLIHNPALLRNMVAEVKTLQCSRKMSAPSSSFTKTPEKTTCPLILVLYNLGIDKARFFVIPMHEILTRQIDGNEEYIKKHPNWKNKFWITRENFVEFEDRWDLLFEEIDEERSIALASRYHFGV